MSECTDEQYRVQISGPRFSVTHEAGPGANERDMDEVFDAACAFEGAFTMASSRLSRPALILAYVVDMFMHHEPSSDFGTVRRAEKAFQHAAEELTWAWDEVDRQVRHRKQKNVPS